MCLQAESQQMFIQSLNQDRTDHLASVSSVYLLTFFYPFAIVLLSELIAILLPAHIFFILS